MRTRGVSTAFRRYPMTTNRLVSLSINVCALGAAFFLAGCQHALTVKNLDQYRRAGVVATQPVSVGLVVQGSDEPSGRLGEGIATGLRNCSTEVIYPYFRSGSFKADVQADVVIHPTYKGSGANFFINFPGFLIFTPAWNGYVYKVDYSVAVKLVRVSDQTLIDEFTLPIKLNVRHADMNRTWTEVSWLEVGIIALGGGIAFMDYDTKVSPLVANATKFTLGSYIAQEIVKRVNTSPVLLTSHPAAAPAVQ